MPHLEFNLRCFLSFFKRSGNRAITSSPKTFIPLLIAPCIGLDKPCAILTLVVCCACKDITGICRAELAAALPAPVNVRFHSSKWAAPAPPASKKSTSNVIRLVIILLQIILFILPAYHPINSNNCS